MAQRRSTRSRNAQRRLARFFTDRSAARRFGALEYLLLALIGLGIAVTIAMAVIDPSA